MKIINGVRYSDEDVKQFGLTGGREAPEGDRQLQRKTVAHVATATRRPKTQAKSKSQPPVTPLNTGDTNPTGTEADGQDAKTGDGDGDTGQTGDTNPTGTETDGQDAKTGDGDQPAEAKPAARKAR